MVQGVGGAGGYGNMSIAQLEKMVSGAGLNANFIQLVAQKCVQAGAADPEKVQQMFDTYNYGNTQKAAEEPSKVGQAGAYTDPRSAYKTGATTAASSQAAQEEQDDGWFQPELFNKDGEPITDPSQATGGNANQEQMHAESGRVQAAKETILNDTDLRRQVGAVAGGEVVNDGGKSPGLVVREGAFNPGRQLFSQSNQELENLVIAGYCGRNGMFGAYPEGAVPPNEETAQAVGANQSQRVASAQGGATAQNSGGNGANADASGANMFNDAIMEDEDPRKKGQRVSNGLGNVVGSATGGMQGGIGAQTAATASGRAAAQSAIGGAAGAMGAAGVIGPTVLAGAGGGGIGGGGGGNIIGSLSGASSSGNLSGLVGKGISSSVGTGLLSMGFPGMAYQMRSQMRYMATELKDQNLINMINDPNLSIEALLQMFLAQVSERMEERLRDKMDEMAVQEQLKTRAEHNSKTMGALGSIAGLAIGGPMGMQVGAAAGQSIANGISSVQRIGMASTKSETVMQAELQVLVQKWKQMFEMSSNMLKALHDMAMTAIRNIRG